MTKKDVLLGQIVLGIDPGSRLLGLCAIQPNQGQNGKLVDMVQQKIAGETKGHRYDLVATAVRGAMERNRPSIVGVEAGFVRDQRTQPFWKGRSSGPGQYAGQMLAEIRGVCILEAHRYGATVVEVSIQRAKSSVTGRGNASKDQVQRAVTVLLGLEYYPSEDEADAAAIALAASGSRLTFGKVHGTI